MSLQKRVEAVKAIEINPQYWAGITLGNKAKGTSQIPVSQIHVL
jgi:hypothetical protein